jgi:hypothetical protein
MPFPRAGTFASRAAFPSRPAENRRHLQPNCRCAPILLHFPHHGLYLNVDTMPAAVETPSPPAGIGKVFKSRRKATAKSINDSDAASSNASEKHRNSLDTAFDRLRDKTADGFQRRGSDESSRSAPRKRKLSKLLRRRKDSDGESSLSRSQTEELSLSSNPNASTPDIVLDDNGDGSLLTEDEDES